MLTCTLALCRDSIRGNEDKQISKEIFIQVLVTKCDCGQYNKLCFNPSDVVDFPAWQLCCGQQTQVQSCISYLQQWILSQSGEEQTSSRGAEDPDFNTSFCKQAVCLVWQRVWTGSRRFLTHKTSLLVRNLQPSSFLTAEQDITSTHTANEIVFSLPPRATQIVIYFI